MFEGFKHKHKTFVVLKQLKIYMWKSEYKHSTYTFCKNQLKMNHGAKCERQNYKIPEK